MPPRRPSCSARPTELLPDKAAAQLLGLVYTTPKPRTVPAFLEHLAATDPVEIRLHLLGYYTQRPPRDRAGDAPARGRGRRRRAIGELLDGVPPSTSMPTKCAEWSGCSSTDPAEASGRSSISSRAGPSTSCRRSAPDDPTLAERDAEAKRELVQVGPARAGRRAARARHPVDAGAGDRPRRALPRVLAAPVGLHERVQAREDLLPSDHRRPRARGPGRSGRARPRSTRRSATRAA